MIFVLKKGKVKYRVFKVVKMRVVFVLSGLVVIAVAAIDSRRLQYMVIVSRIFVFFRRSMYARSLGTERESRLSSEHIIRGRALHLLDYGKTRYFEEGLRRRVLWDLWYSYKRCRRS